MLASAIRKKDMADFSDNKFAKKYKKTLEKRDKDRGSKSKALKKYKVGTKDEYPKKFRNAFTEAVGIYNKNHPE